MGKQCFLCGNETIFYVWTTSRYFPIKKLLNMIKSRSERTYIRNIGVPICFRCYRRICNEGKN